MGKLNKKEIKRLKERKKHNKIFFIFLISALVLFSFIFLFFKFFSNKVPPELTQGELAKDFCMGKCNGNDYYTSYNNSYYNFIRCECVVGIKFSHSEKLGGADYPEINIFYFDSQTLREITKEEVLSRIKN